MGSVSLRYGGNDKSFVAEWGEPGTCVDGTLLDSEVLAIALSLVPGACMSKPVMVAEEVPPDAQGGWSTFQSRLNCTGENATALLATGFSFDAAAAREARQYQIPDATINGLREEITRVHAEYYRRLAAWFRAHGKREPTPPVEPW
jgi:hypothetical protein